MCDSICTFSMWPEVPTTKDAMEELMDVDTAASDAVSIEEKEQDAERTLSARVDGDTELNGSIGEETPPRKVKRLRGMYEGDVDRRRKEDSPPPAVGAGGSYRWLSEGLPRRGIEFEDPDDKYYYVSEDDEEGGAGTICKPVENANAGQRSFSASDDQDRNGRGQNNPGTSASFRNNELRTGGMTYAGAAAKRSDGGSCSSPSNSHPSPSSSFRLVDNSEGVWKEIRKLGNFKKIEGEDKKKEVAAKIIAGYAYNSIDLPPSARQKLYVRTIYQKENENSFVSKAKKGLHLAGREKEFSMYLWFKTTPDSLRRLNAEKNECTAFYDMLTRALPKPLKDIKENTRLVILLCKVELGKQHLSRDGFQKWKSEMLWNWTHEKSKSVLGTGERVPNPRDHDKIGNVLVPCGETMRNNRFANYNLTYNEYMVKEAKRITPKFLIEIDILSK